MVIHIDSFANERRFVCILKCRRTRQTRVVSWWSRVSDGCVAPPPPPPPPPPPGWPTDNVGRRNQRASQTPTSTASGALHRRRLPAHRGYFTEHIVAPPPPEAAGASPTVSSTTS